MRALVHLYDRDETSFSSLLLGTTTRSKGHDRTKTNEKKEAEGEQRKTTHDMNGRRVFNVLSRIYASWMPSRTTFVLVRVTRRVLFKKEGRGRGNDAKDDGYVRVPVSPSAWVLSVEGKAQVASSYLHAPLISSSLSTVGGHSRFRASCSVFTHLLLDERTPWIASSLSNVISVSFGCCDVAHACPLLALKRNGVVEWL